MADGNSEDEEEGEEDDDERFILNVESPELLRDLCLDTVTQLLYRLNDCGVGSKFLWLKKPDCNPFLALPDESIEEIVERFKTLILKKEEERSKKNGYTCRIWIKKEVIKILYCKPVRKMDLSSFLLSPKDSIEVLRTIEGTTKPKIESLGIRVGFAYKRAIDRAPLWTRFILCHEFLIYLYYMLRSYKMYRRYLSTLSALTHITLVQCSDDETLDIIGANCPHLLVIEMYDQIFPQGCTNTGLAKLCLDSNQYKRCQQLQVIKLDVRNKLDLVEGVVLLLQNLPRLRIFEEADVLVGSALLQLQEQSFTCQLEKFHHDGSYSGCQASVIANTCPLLKTLSVIDITTMELLAFVGLKHLTELSLYEVYQKISFQSGVKPLLQAIGHNLRKFLLKSEDVIDFSAINEYCPRLKELNCFTARELSVSLNNMPPSFSTLESLGLGAGQQTGLKAELCVQLLSHCFALRELFITSCEDLDTHHLQTILQHNPLQNLKTIRIESRYMYLLGTVTTNWGEIISQELLNLSV